MENNLPKRKPTRLSKYDYGSIGAYFVTMCVKDRSPILSKILVGDGALDVPQIPNAESRYKSVGDGALDVPQIPNVESRYKSVGDGAFDVPKTPHVELSPIGKIVEKYLLSSTSIPGVIIDKYVIMPDHIHAIIIITKDKSEKDFGTSKAPSPTNRLIPHVISVFKRFCSLEIGENVFQRGYYDHIIRDKEDYETRCTYIHENPMRWYYKQREE
jgi:REP element-mobilizing transposase RayT